MKSEEQKDLLISEGITEDGIEVGNHYDKYNSKNPIVKRIMKGFHDSLESMVEQAHPASIHEVGCGEGFWVIQWPVMQWQLKL